jgi:hypothetical protein
MPSNRPIGYLIAAVGMLPLMWWARRDNIGMAALITFAAALAIWFGIYRWKYGHFPGDEEFAHMSWPEWHRMNRPAYAYVLAMIALGVVCVIYIQSKVP